MRIRFNEVKYPSATGCNGGCAYKSGVRNILAIPVGVSCSVYCKTAIARSFILARPCCEGYTSRV